MKRFRLNKQGEDAYRNYKEETDREIINKIPDLYEYFIFTSGSGMSVEFYDKEENLIGGKSFGVVSEWIGEIVTPDIEKIIYNLNILKERIRNGK